VLSAAPTLHHAHLAAVSSSKKVLPAEAPAPTTIIGVAMVGVLGTATRDGDPTVPGRVGALPKLIRPPGRVSVRTDDSSGGRAAS
jgi:hypothetical protein